MLEKPLESPLDCKEIQPVHPKGDQSWVFIGRTDAEAETPILWPPGAKSWLIWKDHEVGKDWGQEEKGTVEDEMVRWHHQLNDMSLSKLWELVIDRETWRAAIHGIPKSQTWLNNWTKLMSRIKKHWERWWWVQFLRKRSLFISGYILSDILEGERQGENERNVCFCHGWWSSGAW